MSLTKAMRNKRYKVQDDKSVFLIIETNSGAKFQLKIINCSFTGVLASIEASYEITDSSDFAEDSIMSSSKIAFDQEELFIGRLVVRRKVKLEEQNTYEISFSMIDGRIPLDGKLSKFLDFNFDDYANKYDFELNSEKFTLANFVDQDFSNVDIFDRVQTFDAFYKNWQHSKKFGYFHERTASMGSRINLSRKRKGDRRDYLIFASNDYLGLASNKEVIEAAKDALDKYGVGSTGTPPTSGTSDLHQALCNKIASMYGKESAIVYPSGYNANVGIIAGLAREQDLIVADFLSHASIQDGMLMSKATCRFFKHNDMKHLEQILQQERDKYGGCLIATEGLFSMDGTIGKVDEIIKLSREYNARVFVDQGHCMGVLGERGLGTVEKYNVIDQTDIIMGLFSKTIGTLGGFVTGRQSLINWLKAYSRSYMFATSYPPAIAAATLKSLEIIERMPELRLKLKSNVEHFVKGLVDLGSVINPSHCTPIVPIEIRDEQKMGDIYTALLNDGIFSMPIVYPVVSRNKCRFRFSIRVDHSISDLDYVLSSLEKAMRYAGFSFDQIKNIQTKKDNE